MKGRVMYVPLLMTALVTGLLHGTVIEDLAFAHLSKTFCLPVKIKDWAGKRLDRVYHADLGSVEGTADGLFKLCASLFIEERHRHIVKSLAHKIELAFKGYSIVASSKGAVQSVGFTVSNLPVRDELRDGAFPSLCLVIKITITVPLKGNVTERAGYEKSSNVDKIELLARFIG